MTTEPDQETTDTEAPTTLYPNLNAWVEDFLALIYNRAPGAGRAWCPQWWNHDEAYYRLDALWRAWEHNRVYDGPLGAATWLVNYADPLMTVLMQPDGCFKGCKDGEHRAFALNPGEKLPTEPQPGVLQEDRELQQQLQQVLDDVLGEKTPENIPPSA